MLRLISFLFNSCLHYLELPLDLILKVPLLAYSLALEVLQALLPLLLRLVQQVKEVCVALCLMLSQQVDTWVRDGRRPEQGVA